MSKEEKNEEETAASEESTETEDEAEDREDDVEEEDEEDVEDEPAAAAPVKAPKHAPAPPPQDGAEDPGWWLPHAVLATLVLIGVAGFFGAFSGLVKSPMHATSASAEASASAAPAKTAPAPTARPTSPPKPGAPALDPTDPVFAAKQILVQYKDAKRSKQTRSKADAKARAEQALAKLKAGTKFEDVVTEFSDEEGAAPRGGLLGRFKRGVQPEPVQTALEKTPVDKTTDVVESELGFHILLRTQ
jgi:parvulin-like peptidyl-prolyl isomerase